MNEDMIGSFASCSQHDRMPTDEFHPLPSTMIVYNYYLTRDSVQNFYHPLTERKRRVVEQYVAFLYFVQLVTLYPQRQLPWTRLYLQRIFRGIRTQESIRVSWFTNSQLEFEFLTISWETRYKQFLLFLFSRSLYLKTFSNSQKSIWYLSRFHYHDIFIDIFEYYILDIIVFRIF